LEHVTQIVLDAKSHTVTLSNYILTKRERENENERVRWGRGLSLPLSPSLSLSQVQHLLLSSTTDSLLGGTKTKHLLDLLVRDCFACSWMVTWLRRRATHFLNVSNETCFSKRSFLKWGCLKFQMCCEVGERITPCYAEPLCICYASRCTGLIKIRFRR
jgi:hypothetical protein